MTMAITRRDIDQAHAMVRRQQRDAEKAQAKQEHYTGQLTQSLEVGAGALASGVLSGRFGALSLGPVPLDLASALGLHALGFFNVLGKWSNDVHNVADGMLAAYLVKLGAGLGTQWRIQAGQSPFTTSGADPSQLYAPYGGAGLPAPQYPAYGGVNPNAWAQGGGLSEADLAAMAALA